MKSVFRFARLLGFVPQPQPTNPQKQRGKMVSTKLSQLIAITMETSINENPDSAF